MDIDKLITEALDKVNKEIEKSRIGKDTDRELPIAMLLNIKLELTKMLGILDKTKYHPSYPRFLLDYPDTKLADILLDVSYKYKKMT
ncbi:hypothetical protein [Prevotella pallens]|uniref:hypothetical protein n=1 Tax=Prevotella pallens TaxID=60133 RepID=UPI001CB007F3|nr:hypothetical protein [Prevotella pallens]MBF1477775.1 hypothetical protein [Prevotella pallens]